MSSEEQLQKIKLILCDLPFKTTQSDIESFLSPYKDSITSIYITEPGHPIKAFVSFKSLEVANKVRYEMDQKKLQNKIIRIMHDEKDFIQKNKDSKNNLYVKGIPKNKDAREIFEYFWKFGEIFSFKVNEDDNKDKQTKSALLTYYKEEDAKKSMDETNNKKIWNSDMEVQYRKNNNNNYGYNNNRNNLKININNLPEKYTEKDIEELCKDFGKCEIIDIKNNQKGKYAIVKLSSESEVKKAIEQLNNKEIDNKKLYVKEYHYYNNHKYQNNNNNNYKQRGNFPPNFFYPAPPVNMMNNTPSYNNNNIPFQKVEENYENKNLYVTNIPYEATEEDFKKTFSQYGPIKSIKLEEDKEETSKDEKSDKNVEKVKKKFINKSYGYVLFENVEDAKKALESLQGKQLIGFESYYKRLEVQYFIPKEKRNNMTQNPNFYNMQNPPSNMMYPGVQTPYMPFMMPMPLNMMQNNQYRNQQYMRYHGNMKNNDYRKFNNNNYRGRGGNRGGKNYYQKRNNNNSNSNNSNKGNNYEKKIEFDYENYNKIENVVDKKDFLGEKLFNLIQENKIIKEKGENNDDLIARITGMIIAIPNEKEIIEILESPTLLEERIKEALKLIEANK